MSVALSSGEAEFYGVVRAAGIALGHKALLEDVGLTLPARVRTDSSAAIGVVNRKGCGKLRHVRVGMLWIQERVETGDLEVAKVLGTENPADLMTKHMGTKLMEAHVRGLRQEIKYVRADAGLKV